MKIILRFAIIILGIFLLTNCTKEVVKTDTVFVTDTVTVMVHDTIVKLIPGDSGSIFFLVRHAETTGGGSDPHLSAAGMDRANKLASILKNNELDAVYSTSFFRTQETAQAVASEFGLTVINYDPTNLADFANSLIGNHLGGMALVVGHSNTTPELLNKLTNSSQYQTINDTIYDNLYIVHKNLFETKVIHLKY